jgi:hypothetical protein
MANLAPYQTNFTKVTLLVTFQIASASFTTKKKTKTDLLNGSTTKELHTYGSNDYERGMRIL